MMMMELTREADGLVELLGERWKGLTEADGEIERRHLISYCGGTGDVPPNRRAENLKVRSL